MPEYIPAIVAARGLYVSRAQGAPLLRQRGLKGFRVGLARTAAVQIARSSVIEFGKENQGRTITQAEIDQCLEE